MAHWTGQLQSHEASIFDNVLQCRYGKPAADDNEVHKAAEAASMHQTITQRFPKEYGTEVRP